MERRRLTAATGGRSTWRFRTWWANGDFSQGLTGWQAFATPDSSYLVPQVTNDGVLEFYRLPSPPGESHQAVVLQSAGFGLAVGTPLQASFALGKSSSVRKRVAVLLHDVDFTDLSLCTFWLAPGAALATYGMRARTTKAWTNATVSFYAASEGSHGGFYRLDNVAVQPAIFGVDGQTDCIDPTAPLPSAAPAGPEMLTNGSFATGTTSGWSLFGQLVSQVVAGVFEFFRPSATPNPAGVILQPTGQPAVTGEMLTTTFELGNSSAVRKRVTVLLHDLDFADLSACAFWLPPGQPLSLYTMRSFTTKAWTNATISIYAATAGNETWTRLDNVSLRRTPGAATVGTDCLEPGGAAPDGAGGGGS